MLGKSDFDAGKPYSCWLREEVCGEIGAYLNGFENRGLIKKYKVEVDSSTVDFVMNVVSGLDDYPDGLKQVAIDIIKMELDENFIYRK